MTQPDEQPDGQLNEQPDERPGTAPRRREADWERRRRLAEVFGDSLPDTTSDERDPDGRPEDTGRRSDTWLREQVPPHHGG